MGAAFMRHLWNPGQDELNRQPSAHHFRKHISQLHLVPAIAGLTSVTMTNAGNKTCTKLRHPFPHLMGEVFMHFVRILRKMDYDGERLCWLNSLDNKKCIYMHTSYQILRLSFEIKKLACKIAYWYFLIWPLCTYFTHRCNSWIIGLSMVVVVELNDMRNPHILYLYLFHSVRILYPANSIMQMALPKSSKDAMVWQTSHLYDGNPGSVKDCFYTEKGSLSLKLAGYQDIW